MENKCWLPDIVYFEDYNGDWESYVNTLYAIFKSDFIDSRPIYDGMQVLYNKHPMVEDKEEAFIHITHQDYNKNGERLPDLRRCERIGWIRAFIENPECGDVDCLDCSGLKIWEEKVRGKMRIHLLFEAERFLVVIERRGAYLMLITSFYLEHNHNMRKKLEKYKRYAK